MIDTKALNLLDGSKILYLAPDSKTPDGTEFPRGHLDGIPMPEIIERNYGIVLDGQYIVVDIDSPSNMTNLVFPNFVWTQKTRKGYHKLYRAPAGWNGGNIKLKNADGVVYGDLKSRGYIVGPGSHVQGHTYEYIGGTVDDVPGWILDLYKTRSANVVASGNAVNGIPRGEHDQYLFEVASWLRGRYALSEGAIAKVLRRGPVAALQDVDENRPYTEDDLTRIAHSVARYEPSKHDGISLLPESWQTALDIDTNMPLAEWLLFNFIPLNELVLVYGDGGIGKSTLMSFIAALALRRGLQFGVCSVEEPFIRFVVRTMLSLDPSEYHLLANLVNIGNLWKTPDTIPQLREALSIRKLDVIYFDAIKSHANLSSENGDASVVARAALSPLAALAQEMQITVIGTLHTNKLGGMAGSNEWSNVPRVVLEASRKKDKPLRLKVKKTNFNQPDYSLIIDSTEMVAKSIDGQVWKQRDEDGVIQDTTLIVATGYRKSTGEDEESEKPEVEVYDDPRWPEIQNLLDGGATYRVISSLLGIGKSTIQDIVARKGKLQKISHISFDK